MTPAWVLVAMALLAPGRDHQVLASAIARVVSSERPIFRDDDDKRKTSALVIAVAYRESGFVLGAVGDGGHSFCAMQIHDSSGGSRALLEDADACIRKGLAMLRISVRACPEHPIAWYASGPRGCENARAQRISRDRTSIAQRLVREVAP